MLPSFNLLSCLGIQLETRRAAADVLHSKERPWGPRYPDCAVDLTHPLPQICSLLFCQKAPLVVQRGIYKLIENQIQNMVWISHVTCYWNRFLVFLWFNDLLFLVTIIKVLIFIKPYLNNNYQRSHPLFLANIASLNSIADLSTFFVWIPDLIGLKS